MLLAVGAVDTSLDVQIVDDTGLAVTGLVAATFPTVVISKGTGADITPALSDLASLVAAHSDGGVFERGGGVYRFDPPDTLASTAAAKVTIRGEASGKHLLAPEVQVGLPAATANQIADHVKRRTQANTEASSDGDSLSDETSLYGFIQQAQNSNTVDNAGFLTVYTTADVELGQIPITSGSADPVTGVG